MKKQIIIFTALLAFAATIACSQNVQTITPWVKYTGNPVLGGAFGTIFDISVLKTADGYLMYCSWRPKKSIAISESKDGFHWSDPEVVLSPDSSSGWENDLNRPVVVKRAGKYHMWYTGQISTGGRNGVSKIGYATSKDGRHWRRVRSEPVLSPELPWEKTAVMCPHVIWDNAAKLYKMWYSGGEQYEPDAIGYATSKDGINWNKYTGNPVFASEPANSWEHAKVTACQVIKQGKQYYMFYIGFKNVDYAQIGMAKSANGITNWKRYAGNPIISPGTGWDGSAVYKPFVIYDGKQWLLWYNGRKDGKEQIGVATHQGKYLGF